MIKQAGWLGKGKDHGEINTMTPGFLVCYNLIEFELHPLKNVRYMTGSQWNLSLVIHPQKAMSEVGKIIFFLNSETDKD